MAQSIQVPAGHAVVIGGSIAGLLTARVLSDHFARITIVERDSFPDQPDFRKGAPHARHAHGLLVRGQHIMEGFFPGLTDELYAQGALSFNAGYDLALSIGGAAVQPFATDLAMTACSRPLLEHTLRRRVALLPQVQLFSGCDVLGLLADDLRQRATGVIIRRRNHPDRAEERITADLVVDASGRSSRLPDWLAELGYIAPTETTVDAQTSYTTRLYRRPAGRRTWKVLYAIPQAPEQSRGCIIAPLEGDRWHVTLTGLNGDYPPTDPAGFSEFAKSVPVPEFYQAIANAEPLSEPYSYRNSANRWRHYEALPRYLEGVLALGDSVYALNPVYGQGMTVAAVGAETLAACLTQHRRRRGNDYRGLARTFQRRLAAVNTAPWQLATQQDLRWPAAAVDYRPNPPTRAMQAYFNQVLIAMTSSGEVASAFTRVQNMLASPASLFHPRIVWQVLAHGLMKPKAQSVKREVQSLLHDGS
jgi:2-polyprenyl-6-methoxyphenol hydroxylase-like FAD-dependent oxidoreductase